MFKDCFKKNLSFYVFDYLQKLRKRKVGLMWVADDMNEFKTKRYQRQ